MSKPTPLYQLKLEDYSTPSFVSASKPYFGTRRQILTLLARRENKALLWAATQYFSGGGDGCAPLLHWTEQAVSGAERLGTVPFQAEDLSASFLNVWNCPYALQAQRAEGKLHYLRLGDGSCFRALQAVFTGLTCDGEALDRFQFWGYPGMLYHDRSGRLRSRLLLAERRFRGPEEALADLAHPAPPSFDCFFEDIFGDG